MENKHSFLVGWRLPFLFPALRGLGGAGPKTAARPGRFRGGGPSRTPYPIKGNHLPIGYLLKTHLIDIIIIVLYLGRK